jgi:hypothetical protein
MKSSSIIFAAALCAAPVLAENLGTWSFEPGCSGVEEDPNSNCVVDSGGEGSGYARSQDCTMTFHAAAGVEVAIASYGWDVEEDFSNPTPMYDYMQEVETEVKHDGDEAWMTTQFTTSRQFKWTSDYSVVDHGFKLCPVTPGWNIIAGSTSACHVLTGKDEGCIADDAAGLLGNGNSYANNQECQFMYIGNAMISFAGNKNEKGSHFSLENTGTNLDGSDRHFDFVQILSGGKDSYGNSKGEKFSGTHGNEFQRREVTEFQRFKFKSDYLFTGGGFKICDDKSYADPTDFPTAAPTNAPTDFPTAAPTAAPTDFPTAAPTAAPTDFPTAAPTAAPTKAPTAACVPGQSGQGGGDCQDCGIGTHSTTYNALKCEPCLAHPANGAWTHAAGQSDANCPWGCADGHSPTHGGTKCDAEGATLSLKAGSQTALFTMHKNGALKLSGGDDICIEAPNCAPAGSTSADSHNRRLGDMGAELSTRVSALEAMGAELSTRMAALEAR